VQWWFYVGARGAQAPNLAQAPKFLIGSIVISLSRYCLPDDEGPDPQIFFLEPPLSKCCISDYTAVGKSSQMRHIKSFRAGAENVDNGDVNMSIK